MNGAWAMTTKLLVLLVFCTHAQTTVVYTPRELEVTQWPTTVTTTWPTTVNSDLSGVKYDQEIDYMGDYEATATEFIQSASASDLAKLKEIKIRMAPGANSTKTELNVTDSSDIEELHKCRNWTADNGDYYVSHFPHRIEIGLQFTLNMVTLVSWLIVIIGTVFGLQKVT